MTTSDTTPRVSTLFYCVLFSNSYPSPKRLQRPIAQGQCHRSFGRSVIWYILILAEAQSPHWLAAQ